MRRTLYFTLNLLKTPFRLCQWDRMSFSLEILTGSGCVYANELGGGGWNHETNLRSIFISQWNLRSDLFSQVFLVSAVLLTRRRFSQFPISLYKSSFNPFDANFIQSGLQVDLWWPVKFQIIVWWPKLSVPQSCARFRLMISLTLPLF